MLFDGTSFFFKKKKEAFSPKKYCVTLLQHPNPNFILQVNFCRSFCVLSFYQSRFRSVNFAFIELHVLINVSVIKSLLSFSGTEDHDELKIIFLEEEIKELKKTLKEERLRNNYLTQLLEQAQKLKVQPQ